MTTKPYSLTLFHNAFDNQTNKTMDFEDWDAFVNLLSQLYQQPIKSKKDAQLISPSVYEMGTTRANRNVVEWGHWACADVDDFTGNVEDILDRFKEYNTVIYSTASSTIEQPKFRIVFDLDRRVPSDQLRHFWFALNKLLGDLGDPQTKDASRMYYIPATYEGSNHFFYRNKGEPIAVDRLLRAYPYVAPTGNSFLDKLPEEMKDKVLQHRKDSMDNTSITWTGYLDCPFVPNKMVMKYLGIAGTGWYSGLYKIMIAIASNAIRAKYPISAAQIAMLCREIDQSAGSWYENRPFEREAHSAINWAYSNTFEE